MRLGIVSSREMQPPVGVMRATGGIFDRANSSQGTYQQLEASACAAMPTGKSRTKSGVHGKLMPRTNDTGPGYRILDWDAIYSHAHRMSLAYAHYAPTHSSTVYAHTARA